jgi:hypothetical protein
LESKPSGTVSTERGDGTYRPHEGWGETKEGWGETKAVIDESPGINTIRKVARDGSRTSRAKDQRQSLRARASVKSQPKLSRDQLLNLVTRIRATVGAFAYLRKSPATARDDSQANNVGMT